jgi:transposase
LFYGDESHICSEGYVPYGWQFPDEDIYIPVEKGYKINIWGLINRYNQNHWVTTEQNIDAHFVFEQLEKLSFQIQKQTVIMLDNASIHKAKIIKQQLKFWEKRGLYIFYIPPYSPHLNIAETLWRKIKKEQIDPIDYLNKETLFYAVNRCLPQLGNAWKIKFCNFNIN